MRWIACATLACLAALTAPARAEDKLAPRVLLIPFAGKGPPAPARLSEAIVRIAGERGARASVAETGLAETALLVGCDPADAACLDAMASALNVDHLIFGEVRRRGRATVVEVTVTARQQPAARASVEIPSPRDADAAGDLVAAEVVRLLESLEQAAREAAAEAPPPAPAPEPPPTPAPAPVPTARPEPRGAPLWTWSLLVGGVAIAATGGAVWGSGLAQRGDIDGAPTSSAADLEELRDLEDSAELRLRVGGAMAIAGAAIAITGGVLVLRSRGDEPAPAVAATPLPGGGALTLSGRF